MTNSRLIRVVILMFGIGSTAACSDQGRQRDRFSVRDSAGIEVVRSTSPAWGREAGWVVSPNPVLELGLVDGPEEYTFDRIGRAFRLADRKILVPNRRTNELRLFEEDGSFNRAVGGTGEGPGEYRSMTVWLGSADSIWIDDPRLGRITQLGPDAEFVKSVRLTAASEMGAPTAFGNSSSGFWVTSALGGFGAGADGFLEGFQIFFSHYDAEGQFDGIIAEFRGPRQWAHTSGGMTSAGALPHTIPWTVHAANRDYIFLGGGVDPEIQMWTQDGELTRVIRWDASERQVGGPEIERFTEDFLGRHKGSSDEEFWNGWLRDVPFPDALPTYDKLMVDRTGHLWAREYHPTWEDSQTWMTFSPNGEWLGSLGVPSKLTITDIGSDYILGRWTDEMDVQYVRLYALDRGS